MTAQIRLTRESPFLNFAPNRRQSERLRVSAEGTGGADSKIFLHQQPLGGSAEFVGVATKIDLDTYPEDAADPDLGPYFRLAAADLLLRDPQEVQEIWDDIVSDTTRLVNAINQAAVDEEPDSVFMGQFNATAAVTTGSAGTGLEGTRTTQITMAAALRVGRAAALIAATAIPPVFTASVGVQTGLAAMATAATTRPPVSRGTIAKTVGRATMAAAGTVTPPVYTGTSSKSTGRTRTAAAGTMTPPVYAGTGIATAGPADAEVTGTTTPPTFSGLVNKTLARTAGTGLGSMTPPVYTGFAGGTIGGATSHAFGSTDPSLFAGNIAVSTGRPNGLAAGSSLYPVYSGSVAKTVGKAAAALAGSTVLPLYSGSAAKTTGRTATAITGTVEVPLGPWDITAGNQFAGVPGIRAGLDIPQAYPYLDGSGNVFSIAKFQQAADSAAPSMLAWEPEQMARVTDGSSQVTAGLVTVTGASLPIYGNPVYPVRFYIGGNWYPVQARLNSTQLQLFDTTVNYPPGTPYKYTDWSYRELDPKFAVNSAEWQQAHDEFAYALSVIEADAIANHARVGVYEMGIQIWSRVDDIIDDVTPGSYAAWQAHALETSSYVTTSGFRILDWVKARKGLYCWTNYPSAGAISNSGARARWLTRNLHIMETLRDMDIPNVPLFRGLTADTNAPIQDSFIIEMLDQVQGFQPYEWALWEGPGGVTNDFRDLIADYVDGL